MKLQGTRREDIGDEHNIMYFDSNSGICSRARNVQNYVQPSLNLTASTSILHIAASALSRSRRRMRPIGRDDTIGIVRLTLHILPRCLNSWQYLPPIMNERDVWHRLRRVFRGAHGTWIGGIVIIWARVRADGVARLGADEGIDVCSDVPAAEGVQAPVCFYGGDLGVWAGQVSLCCELKTS